jgi:hypothetical protein
MNIEVLEEDTSPKQKANEILANFNINKIIEDKIDLAIENYLNKVSIKELIDIFNERKIKSQIISEIDRVIGGKKIPDIEQSKIKSTKARYTILKFIKDTTKDNDYVSYNAILKHSDVSKQTLNETLRKLCSVKILDFRTLNKEQMFTINKNEIENINTYLFNYEKNNK